MFRTRVKLGKNEKHSDGGGDLVLGQGHDLIRFKWIPRCTTALLRLAAAALLIVVVSFQRPKTCFRCLSPTVVTAAADGVCVQGSGGGGAKIR